jgi:protein-L-isoaspartate O-methyltransferase
MMADDIKDFGEKIGGARKDTAQKTGPKAPKPVDTDTRPGWAKRFVAAETFTRGPDGKSVRSGQWTLLDTRKKGSFMGNASATRQTFPEGAEREAINAKFDKLFEAMKVTEVVKPAPGFTMPTTMRGGMAADAMAGMKAANASTERVTIDGKSPAGWSDEARAASAEMRAANAKTPAAEIAKAATPAPAKVTTGESSTPKRTPRAKAEAKPRAAVAGDNGGPSDKAIKTAAKLEAVAKRTMEAAQKEADRPRQMNTARRARMGGGMIKRAQQDIADAKTALKIANALRNGEAGALSNVASLADIRELRSLERRAMYIADRVQKRNYDPGRTTAREDLKHAVVEKPFLHLSTSDVEEMRAIVGKGKGLAGDLKTLERARRTDGDVRLGTKELDALRRVSNAVKEAKSQGELKHAHQLKHAQYKANRYLDSLRTHDRQAKVAGADIKETLAAFMDVREGRAKPDPVALAERDLIGRKLPGFFPTPTTLADRMAQMADVKPGMKVLEPSAGTGRLADAVKKLGASVDTVEMQSSLRDVLAKKGHNIIDHDFTAMKREPAYDRIVMNPPFEKGQDMAHVKQAYEMLKPGGKIVAIMGEGAFFRGDKQASEFRSWLDGRGTSEKLPDGTFKESNTGVNTRLVTITKPAEPAYMSPAEISERYRQAYGDGTPKPGSTAMSERQGWSDEAREASAKVRADAKAGHNNPPNTPHPDVQAAVDKHAAAYDAHNKALRQQWNESEDNWPNFEGLKQARDDAYKALQEALKAHTSGKQVWERASLDFKHLNSLSMQELGSLQRSIMESAASKNPEHLAGKSIHIYNKQAKAKLDRIAQEISYRIGKSKAATAAGDNQGWQDAARLASAVSRAENAKPNAPSFSDWKQQINVRQNPNARVGGYELTGKGIDGSIRSYAATPTEALQQHYERTFGTKPSLPNAKKAHSDYTKPTNPKPSPTIQSAVERAMAMSEAKAKIVQQSMLGQPAKVEAVKPPATRAEARTAFMAKAEVKVENGVHMVKPPGAIEWVKTGAGNPAAAKSVVFSNTVSKSLKSFGGLLAPVAIGAAALVAMNESAKAGETASGQAKAGAIEAGKGAAVMGGFVAGTALATKGLLKTGMKLATAVPVVQAALIAGGAVHGAIVAKPGERMKGAAKGAWDMSLPGMVVNTGIAAHEAYKSTSERIGSAPSRLNVVQQADFASANAAYKAKQSGPVVVEQFERQRRLPSGQVVTETVATHTRKRA